MTYGEPATAGRRQAITRSISMPSIVAMPVSADGPVSLRTLIDSHPSLRPIVVDGILRRGEVANIIAAPKVGKSFLAGGLAWSVASGTPWLSHSVASGRVLIVDNELHPEALANRLDRIRVAMQIDSDAESMIDVLALRGRNRSIEEYRTLSIDAGTYSLVIIDALYRTLPRDANENANGDMMAVYSALDHYAAEWDAAIAVVHHSSKGDQSMKSVTDIGAGAGAISRAADTHITIRPHEDDGLCVMEAVTRSFRSPEPVSISYEYPLWHAVTIAPVVRRLGASREAQQSADDTEADETLSETLAQHSDRWLSESQLVRASGMGPSRVARAIGRAAKSKKIKSKKVKRRGHSVAVYQADATADATAKS
jgi:hypothetical protein